MLKCVRCGGIKSPASFNKHRNTSTGYQPFCRDCQKQHNALIRATQGASHGTQSKRRTSYGLEHEDFLKMLKDQGGRCWICNREMTKPCVDHNHRTGQVRGLLCGNCNTGIGLLQDNPDVCLEAAAYLRHFNSMPL